MPDDDESESLFERLGGASGVADIVHDMYQRVLDEPELAPFFANTSMDRLRRMQFQFIASALDGPIEYAGAELNMIHRGRGITAHHFAAFCGHFADAMEARGADPQDIDNRMHYHGIVKTDDIAEQMPAGSNCRYRQFGYSHGQYIHRRPGDTGAFCTSDDQKCIDLFLRMQLL